MLFQAHETQLKVSTETFGIIYLSDWLEDEYVQSLKKLYIYRTKLCLRIKSKQINENL